MAQRIEKNLGLRLQKLADKYETSDFMNADPSQFTRLFKDKVKCEAACFISAMLSFGSRKQFIPKIKIAVDAFFGNDFCDESNLGELNLGVASFVPCGHLHSPAGNDDDKFYRFYSYRDMNIFFDELAEIIREWGSLGNCVKTKWESHFRQNAMNGERNPCGKVSAFPDNAGGVVYLDTIIAECFPKSRIVSKGKNSPNKRTNMFLRWMVRKNSPVDLGFWDWYNPRDLLIPLDVHVMTESAKLGLISETAKPDRKTAVALTEKLKEIWPTDPCKGDYALFGLGVGEE